MDAWPMVADGAQFADIVAELAVTRGEPAHTVRAWLIAWLGELLVLGLIRRGHWDARAANGE